MSRSPIPSRAFALAFALAPLSSAALSQDKSAHSPPPHADKREGDPAVAPSAHSPERDLPPTAVTGPAGAALRRTDPAVGKAKDKEKESLAAASEKPQATRPVVAPVGNLPGQVPDAPLPSTLRDLPRAPRIGGPLSAAGGPLESQGAQAQSAAAATASKALSSELKGLRGMLDTKIDVKGPPNTGKPETGGGLFPPRPPEAEDFHRREAPLPGSQSPGGRSSTADRLPMIPGGTPAVEAGLGGPVMLSREEAPSGQGKIETHLRSARNHLNMREYGAAASEAARALEADPQNAQAFGLRAQARLRTGDAAGAAGDARAAADLDPKNAAALKTLTDALYKAGDYRGALSSVQQWLKWTPRDASAHHRKAAILEAAGDVKGALAALERAASINRRLVPALEEAEKPGGKVRYPDEDEDIAAEELAQGRSRPVLPILLGLAGLVTLGLSLWYARKRQSHWSDALRPAEEQPATAPPFAEKFEKLRSLAKSPIGELVEAKDRKLERVVWIARMPAGEDAGRRKRIGDLARAAAGIRHAGLFDVYEVAEDGQDVCVVTEAPRGKSAAAMVRESGRFPLAQAVRFLEPACEALEAAHAKGVAHRRLSLESLFINDQGAAKIRDLGQLPLDPPPTDDGRRADVVGLALCLYEMATGAKPYGDQGFIPAGRRVPGLPPELDRLLEDALAKDAKPRVAGAADFLARLKALQPPVGAARA